MATTILRPILVSLLLSLACCGCSSAQKERDSYIQAYRRGDVRLAAEGSAELASRKAQSGDAPWILLDRGLIAFAQGDSAEAAKVLRQAIDAIDLYQQSVAAEGAGQILISDGMRAYATDPYEEILARIYLALALYDSGDASNAYAILRQAEERQVQMDRCYPLAKMLFGIACLADGDRSNAEILFRQAGVPTPDKTPSMVVICHNGCVPLKESVMVSGSQIAGLVTEEVIAASGGKPAISSIAGISLPEYAYGSDIPPRSVELVIDGNSYPMPRLCDVSSCAYKELEEKLPAYAARALSRMLVRRGAVAVTNSQNDTAGTIVDLLALVANFATQADTRSWGTLPASIDVAMVSLEAGDHALQVRASGRVITPKSLKLSPGTPSFVHFFQIGPHTRFTHEDTNDENAA